MSPRLGEGGGSVLLCSPDPTGHQVRRPLLHHLQPKALGEVTDEGALARARRSLQAERETSFSTAHQAVGQRDRIGIGPGSTRGRRAPVSPGAVPRSRAPGRGLAHRAAPCRYRHHRSGQRRWRQPPCLELRRTPAPGCAPRRASPRSRVARVAAPRSAPSPPSCGGRSSRANIMRRRRALLTELASFIAQSVGAGARSSSRCMYTLEPPFRPAEKNGCPKSVRLPAVPESKSSISSNRRSERRSRASRRWESRSSCSLSLRLGSSPSSSASPTL